VLTISLPSYPSLRLRRGSGDRTEIYDFLRRRFVSLTPEEWVRQHFTHFLVERRGYPPALLANEVALSLNGTTRRCDTVLYRRTGALPRMIVEYKAPEVALTQAVFDQIFAYNSALRADYLVVSNGREQFVCRVDYSASPARADFLDDVPAYAELA